MTVTPVKLDSWAKDLLVDPLSKEPLSFEYNQLLSPYGRKYPIVGGIYDLRLLNNRTTRDQKRWREGQRQYERWSRNRSAHDELQVYYSEIEGIKEVYSEIPIEGDCLDVGGHQGRLRRFLTEGQNYISCDPFIDVLDDLEKQPNLLKAYPFLVDPVNFICCDAEFLPFRSSCFQTVHMRSVIDHLLNPELALNEVYRVLESGGSLIVGLYVYGGKRGKPDIRTQAKEFTKDMFSALGIDRFRDHHVWHPTYAELTELILECGFEIDKVYWQEGQNDTVCYIRAQKQAGLTRRCT